MTIEQMQEMAKKIRRQVVTMVYESQSGHLGCSLGIVDILTVLYFSSMRIDPQKPKWIDRDRFILSKGHGVSALYATLAARGFFASGRLKTYMKNGSCLAGHVTYGKISGIEATAGALGHGASIGVGIAWGLKMDKRDARVFVLVGDGELQEGSVWEAILFAGFHALSNLILIIDYNNLQIMGKNSEVLNIQPMDDKLKSFRWEVETVDGHNIEKLKRAFEKRHYRPFALIAKTKKGKGVSFMENVREWHTLTPSTQEYEKALLDLL